jgi:transcriptional regulator with PAS, ATPase and Fis domain
MRRYRRVLFDRMSDYSTLITGPSGTGKELVARAIGLSRYVPFDAVAHKFTDDIDNTFFAVNLSALSPTLIESELFGHQRGAYTGALTERCGWLEVCPPSGTVFLDEIGELDGAIQVKLLRVLQSREFSRLGETQSRRFLGKIIAATNRNLAVEIHAGTFREDLYYRLCSDLVSVPSLRARLDDNPQELAELVLHIAQRLVGPEAAAVATEVLTVINQQLGPNYPWPGNIRELEQCVRNVLIRQSYRNDFLASRATSDDPFVQLAETMRLGQLTAEQLLTRYCQLAYAQTGSYEATARQLQLDRRTVKAKVISATNP